MLFGFIAASIDAFPTDAIGPTGILPFIFGPLVLYALYVFISFKLRSRDPSCILNA